MLPIRWAAWLLGAKAVQWNADKHEVSIEIDEDFYHLIKLESFAAALSPQAQAFEAERTANGETRVLPLPERASKIVLSPPRRQEIFTALDKLRQQYNITPNAPQILVTIANEKQSFSFSEVFYCFENHDGRIYVPMALLEELFYTRFDYNADANRLAIQTPDLDKVKQQLSQVESVLTPVSPEEAMNLWLRGEQTRNGALQYTALSPGLRQQVDKSMLESDRFSFWVTGYSSPWVGPITVQEEKKLSDMAIEFTVTFPEVTSAPPNWTATERFIVEKLTVNGTGGWFITRMLQSSGYGLL